MTTIILQPAGRGRYHAVLDGAVLVTSPTPLLSAARALLARGHDEHETLEARHEGSSIIALRGRLGRCAGLTVLEGDEGSPRFAPYRLPQEAREGGGGSSLAAIPA